MLVLAMAALTFTACEDVPAPYAIPGSSTGGADSTAVIAPTGSGTAADPYNVAAAIKLIEALDANVETESDIYVKGIVVSVKEYSTQYGNATFYISDNGLSDNQLYIYRIYGLGNKKFTESSEEIKEGDEVIIAGRFMNYQGNTPETSQGKSWLYSHNGKTEEAGGGTGGGSTEVAGEPKGDGSQANPYNVAGALQVVSALAADVQSEKEYYITGTVKEIREYSTQYGNASFTITDNGTGNSFLFWRGYWLNNEKFTAETNPIAVGDSVVIYGYCVNYYGNTPETVQNKAYVFFHKSNGGSSTGGNTGGGSTNADGSVLASSWNLENASELTTLNMPDGNATLTFDAGGNQNGPKYYNSGTAFRMYPKNSMKVDATKTIKDIKLTCQVSGSTIYNASGDISATAGTVATNNEIVTISGINSKSVTITDISATSGAPSQIRITAILITYAE